MTHRELKQHRKRLYRNYLKARIPPGAPIVLHDSRRISPGQIGFLDEIIVDYFAGGGGASTGMELAAGRPVAIAINHDYDAILLHTTKGYFDKQEQAFEEYTAQLRMDGV